MRTLVLLLLLLAAGMFLVRPGYADDNPQDRPEIQLEGISPDGDTIAFKFSHKTLGTRIGLLEWRTGKMQFIPNPPGTTLLNPSSFEGKYLLAFARGVEGTDLFQIDLQTLQSVKLAHDLLGWVVGVVRQPETQKLLIVKRSSPYYLVQLDLQTGETTTILTANEGFEWAIFDCDFVGANEIVFSGMNPVAADLKQRVKDLGLHEVDSPAYRLSLGGRPELIYPTSREEGGISNVSASRDGKTLAFIGLSRILPYNDKKQFNLEVFTVTDGILRQRTDLRMHMASARMSQDASVVVFAALQERAPRMWRGKQYELYADHFILDLRTDQVIRTRLRNILQERIDSEMKSGLSAQHP